ncbi:LacI family transcriptional regulator [Oleiharenicola lentus]|uniref:LacI family transcriptional regulator n=1 Tax=Oleiharenicola lentus TaxID=2508720 RepID=A0A4Q1C423_9BACT|nr:LacI family DNA-binding transcriptional regulator [Oleiharenicola lentus]RXK53122.1 LacI family transcriptional regulator [Oleiharenicola lentus]
MPRPVTMKTIAAQAGVTQATVSMSLANNPRIPAATRARIRTMAERLGYRPNPYVSALMRSRRQGRPRQDHPVLALVNGLDSEHGWRETASLTVRQMREGAIARAEQLGYRTEEFWLHRDGMSAARFSAMLHHRGIQGLLLGPLPAGAPPPGLAWEQFSAVRLGVPLPSLTITSVCNDHFFSSLQVARECHRRGYERPGLLLLRQHRQHFHARWDGGLLAGRHLMPRFRLTKTLLLEDWAHLAPVMAWLKKEKPDVIVTPAHDVLLDHLAKVGRRVPRDLGFASLALPERPHSCSGIWQNGRLLGATAIDAIVGQLERNERGLPEQTRVIMVEGVWNEGRTLRAPESELA